LIDVEINGEHVFIHEFLHKCVEKLPENKGSIWHPDELTAFVRKAKQYVESFPNPAFFKKVQCWGTNRIFS